MTAMRAGLVVVCVGLASGVTAQDCGTDGSGLIFTDCWLASGPYQNPFGAGGANENFIAPSYIGCEYPAEGDTLRNGFDPAVAASPGLTTNGVNTDALGNPIWFAWDDGSPFDGDQDFLTGPGGNPGNNHMFWLVTYVEYIGDEEPVDVRLCIGSDDATQIWINGDEIFNNFGVGRGRGVCQDVVPVSLPGPGLYAIRGGTWQGGGGWGFSLGLQDEFGLPILSDSPDWIFHGRERPGDFEDTVPGGTECPPCEVPVEVPECEAGPGGLTVRWTNPAGCDCADDIELRIDGALVATAAPDATEAVVPAALVPGGLFSVEITNCSGLRNSCSPACTDADGLILGSCWLANGPYQNPFGCGGAPANFIAPSFIGCEYPAVGEELRNGYDSFVAASNGLTVVPGVNANDLGDPIWYAWDDGTNNGDQDFDGGPAGGLDNHMQWLATYVEYTGAGPVDINLCVGSDDATQIWVNGDAVFNNFGTCRGRGTCQDVVPVSLPGPGLYCIRGAAWEGGGGFGFRLGLQDEFGLPILDGDSDWIFHGRERPADFADRIPGGAECPPCLQPMAAPTCEFVAGGLGVRWTIPPGCDCDDDTELRIGGVTVATVGPDETEALIPSAELPGGIFSVDIVNCSGLAATCSPVCTDTQGLILGSCWLATGPYQNPLGCGGANENFIAPSFIGCEYPAEGEELRNGYDSFVAASNGLTVVPGVNANDIGDPIWFAWDDGTNNGDQDFRAGPAGGLDNHMQWLATYVEYTGAQNPVRINLCLGSDDAAQVWINDNAVFNNFGTCRGVGTCQDVIPVTLPGPGLYCIRGAVWQGGGGWGFRFGLQDEFGTAILDGDPDWVFHGRNRPDDFEDTVPGGTDCPDCDERVVDFSCELEPDGDLAVQWAVPPGSPACDCETDVQIGGVTVATVGPGVTAATISSLDLPAGRFTVDITNCSGLSASCAPFCTDDQGLVLGGCWLATGPYQNPAGCGGGEGNFIAPSFIECEYPVEGEELQFGYDPLVAASSGLTEAPGVNANDVGEPIWYRWDDGTLNGDQDFRTGPAGPLDNHMQWLATYVEYTGVQDPVNINLCLGSDDAAQVWINDVEVFRNFGTCRGVGTCQDVVPVTLPGPGVYCIRGGVWQGGGGWGFRLGLQDEFGTAIVDGDPDWVFHGTERPVGFEPPECCPPVRGLFCSENGEGGVDVSWENPEDGCGGAIRILVYGEEVATLAADATSFTVPAAAFPFPGTITVDNGGLGRPSCSVIPATELHTDLGFVSAWLHLGPFAQQDGAAPGCALMRQDHLTDGEISELAIEPVDGDEIETDFGPPPAGEAASLGLNPAEVCPDCNAGGFPAWKAFTGFDGVTDEFNVNNLVSGGDNQMSYGMFYIDVPVNITVDIGLASDDSIQVLAAPVGSDLVEIWCNSIGRGTGGPNAVQDIIRDVALTRGLWKVMVKVFEGGGGHGWRLRFQDSTGGPLVPGELTLEPGPREINCGDGIDNDGDGDTDCDDPDCVGRAPCDVGGFVRGDVDGDGLINITDWINILGNLFLGNPINLPCSDAADVDDTGAVNITDAIFGLSFSFQGGGPPPAPTPSDTGWFQVGGNRDCGEDPTPDPLDCGTFRLCE